MCGRYTLIKQPTSIGLKSPKKIELPGNADAENLAFKPRYNIAPTQGNLVVRKRPEDERVLMRPCDGDFCQAGPAPEKRLRF